MRGRKQYLGYDGNKHIKGIKRHLLTDTLGNVLAYVVLAANAHETQWLRDVLIAARYCGYERAALVVGDGGYTGQEEYAAVEGFELEIVLRTDFEEVEKEGNELKPRHFKPLPRRWVIERTIGNLMNCRILACCYGRLAECSEALVLWANMRLIMRRWDKS